MLFAAAFVRVGHTGGDMGTSYFLPKTIGMSAAPELHGVRDPTRRRPAPWVAG